LQADSVSMTIVTPSKSRAVIRAVDPGSMSDCALCGQHIRFSAKNRPKQVIANVYEDGKWQRVEYFHAECYADAGRPYGEPVT
jgi:hypothetical protein